MRPHQVVAEGVESGAGGGQFVWAAHPHPAVIMQLLGAAEHPHLIEVPDQVGSLRAAEEWLCGSRFC
ncbi:hypothetical protein EV189_2690 [Motilibacter rhizosphaerae]|uniref:Uncharacterized protein n=1 Tax=Motilibacter rhizosphaerae TaxID=598652 RepID=A0A4Q7NPM3_9ACTN|nr:hypothetical protein EV189_2690 [Motilibacter rhizosphaerae]